MRENQVDARRWIQGVNHGRRRVVITVVMWGLPIIIGRRIPVSLILFIMSLRFVLSVITIAIVPVLIAVSLMVAVVIGKGWRHCHGTEH